MIKSAGRFAYYERLGHRNGLLLGACGLVFFLLMGCNSGPARGEVSGKVTFQGAPVKEGRITFLNQEGLGDSEAELTADGTYVVQGGAVVGDYKVVITPLVVMMDTDPGKSPPAPVEKKAPDIPLKYRQQGKSPLTASVKAGKNQIDFEMKR